MKVVGCDLNIRRIASAAGQWKVLSSLSGEKGIPFGTMSATVTQIDHRTSCWKSLLTAEMNVCYWTYQCSDYNKWDKRLKTFVALTASGTAIASLSIWATYPAIWQIVAVAACVASVIHAQYYSSDRLAKISGLVATWKELAADYDLVWEKYDGELVSTESWEQFEGVKRRERTIDESQFTIDNKLRERAHQEVLAKRGLSNG